MDVDDSYGPGEPQASGDWRFDEGWWRGSKAAKWGIVDMLGGGNDGREGGNLEIKAG